MSEQLKTPESIELASTVRVCIYAMENYLLGGRERTSSETIAKLSWSELWALHDLRVKQLKDVIV